MLLASRCALAVAVLTATATVAAARPADSDAARRSYPIPGHGTLELEFPKAWKDAVSQPPGDLQPTIKLRPSAGDEFDLRITVAWDMTGTADLKNEGKRREDVENHGRGLLAQANEKTLIVERLACESGFAYHCTLTDDADTGKGYPLMTQGDAVIGDLLLIFTYLHRTSGSKEKAAALEMLRTAAHRAAPAAPPDAGDACEAFRKRIREIYDFKPSTIPRAQLPAKGAAEDALWRDVREHQGERVPCLRAALDDPNANPWFLVDGSELLVRVAPSREAKERMIRLWAGADLADVPGERYVRSLSMLDAEGLDVCAPERHWFSSNARFVLRRNSSSGDTFDGAVSLYGSMDEGIATPALAKLVGDSQFRDHDGALVLLALQMTPESIALVRGVDLSKEPADVREAVRGYLSRLDPPDAEAKPAFTRDAALAAFERCLAGDSKPIEALKPAGDEYAQTLSLVLEAKDVPTLRSVRRRRVALADDSSVEEYVNGAVVLQRLLWKFELVK
jgi:hypothetical protein